MLIAVLPFVIKGLLQSTAEVLQRILVYADDQTMAKLYEMCIPVTISVSIQCEWHTLHNCVASTEGTERFATMQLMTL
jgi:peptidoglycan biosynthesis protein MviN/MurJ (putative lipid II flippase)